MLSEHFGKYLLIDKIGTGGMAEVYLAKQSGLKGFEKVLAIKRVLSHLTQDSEFISMFINEAKLAALLTHQNIVQIFDFGHFDNAYYLAMEYVMGKDLRTVLQRVKDVSHPFTIGQVLLIITKICSGLDYAHRRKDLNGRDLNLVHRDISPQNILVSYEGEVKLVDFGIAKAASQGSETRTGFLKGKLAYMAPEQAWGKSVDRRTDIFAAGIVLYEMLTGHKLFKGDNDFNTLEKIREAKVEPPPIKLNAHISPELETIIMKALAKEPEDRFQSAAELQMALEDHMSQKGYDFSTVRLSQHLQDLFSVDLKRDTDRFRAAASTGIAAQHEDQSTLIRRFPRVTRGVAPPATPILKARKRSSPARIAFLTLILFFLSSVWAATNHFAILYPVKIRFPATRLVFDRLARIPDQVTQFLVTLPIIKQDQEPTLKSHSLLPGFSADPTLKKSPLAKEKPPVLPSSTPPAKMTKPGNKMETGQRPLTEAERNEIQRLFKESRVAYDQRRLDKVEQKLRRIIELNPHVPVAYHLLGTVALERKDPVGALQIFEEASRNFPNDPLLHYDLGFLYFSQGVISLGREELMKAVKLDPEGPNAEKARGILEQTPQNPLSEQVPETITTLPEKPEESLP